MLKKIIIELSPIENKISVTIPDMRQPLPCWIFPCAAYVASFFALNIEKIHSGLCLRPFKIIKLLQWGCALWVFRSAMILIVPRRPPHLTYGICKILF